MTTVVLHVGTMKSGTTYLQARLEQNRDRLAADGVLFPGPTWKSQLLAAGSAVTRARRSKNLRNGAGLWGQMRTELLGWTGPKALLSVEHLSRASETQARAIVAALEPSEVRVVLTVRDLGRVVPSAWQQTLKAGDHATFDAFLEAIVAMPTTAQASDGEAEEGSALTARTFWKMQDAARHARRWGGAVGVENLVIVTVPPAGSAPELLWERFCRAVDLDAHRYPTDDAHLLLNPSLGVAAAEVVRRINERLHHHGVGLRQPEHRNLVRFAMANSTLAGMSGDEPVRVPGAYEEWLRSRAQRMVDEIRATGVCVVGDLADLVPDRGPRELAEPGPTGVARAPVTTADATVRAAATLVRLAAGREHDAAGSRGAGRTILADQLDAARRRACQDRGGSPYDVQGPPPERPL